MRWRILIKYKLALLALLLAMALLFWQRENQLGIVLNAPQATTHKGTLEAEKITATPAGVTVDGVRYSGQDTQGNSWQLLASHAEQPIGEAPIGLDQVTAHVHQQGQSDLYFSAVYGAYQPSSNELELRQQVQLHMAGATLTTPLLRANLATQAAIAPGAVTVTMPYGTLYGYGLEVVAGAETIQLNGPVKAVFNLGQ